MYVLTSRVWTASQASTMADSHVKALATVASDSAAGGSAGPPGGGWWETVAGAAVLGTTAEVAVPNAGALAGTPRPAGPRAGSWWRRAIGAGVMRGGDSMPGGGSVSAGLHGDIVVADTEDLA